MSYCVITWAPAGRVGAFGVLATMIGRSILGRTRSAAAGSALRAAAAGLGLRAGVAVAAGLGLLALALVALHFAPPPEVEAQSAPATPASVSVTRAGATLTATWDALAGATKYHVTYSADNGKSWTAAVGPDDNHSAATHAYPLWVEGLKKVGLSG